MTWVFLEVERIEQLHQREIDLFGGSPGLRDAGLLASAVARAENMYNYDEQATLPQIAASLAWGLVKNHAFIDGNKRVGMAALVTLLDMNGYAMTSTSDEATLMVQRMAASEVNEGEWTAWVERSAARLG